MEQAKLPSVAVKDLAAWSVETFRSRLHGADKHYRQGPRVRDAVLAEEMAYAERPYIERAIANMAVAQETAQEKRGDTSPYAHIRMYVYATRIEKAGREAMRAVALAEQAAGQVAAMMKSGS